VVEQPLQRILDNIRTLGLNDNLVELETQGYTTITNVLSEAQIERAKASRVSNVRQAAGSTSMVNQAPPSPGCSTSRICCTTMKYSKKF